MMQQYPSFEIKELKEKEGILNNKHLIVKPSQSLKE
jgi:hypothetical protein